MKSVFGFILGMILVSALASADIMPLGFKGIDVENKIVNLNEYADYVFFSAGRISPQMCPIKIIDEAGIVPSYYKYCDVSVFAVQKNKFNEDELNKYANNFNSTEQGYLEYIKEYVNAKGGKEVLSGISTYITVPITSTEKSRIVEYKVSLTNKGSSDVIVGRNNLVYWYGGASLIALMVILYLIFRRK